MKAVSGVMRPAIDASRLTSVPRDVQLTANGWAMLVMAIVIAAAAVAAALGLSILHARQQEAADLRAREAVHADATVVRAARTGGDHPRTVVTFRYEAQGAGHVGSARLSARRSLAEGDRLGIAYLRSDPDQTWVEGNEPGVFPLWLVPPIAAGLLLFAGLIAWAVRREEILMSEGRFADARVVSTKKVQRQHHHAYRVEYQFTTLSGMRVTSRAEKRRAPADVGATVAVIYHRDNPRWNAIYPLPLVTPARFS